MASPWIPDRLRVLCVSGGAPPFECAPDRPDVPLASRDQTLVSVVIPSRGKPGLLRGTLQALRQRNSGREIEVIVVHQDTDMSVDEALGQAGASVPRFSAIAEGALTPARARNLGFAHSTGECVVFLEPGAELPADWAGVFCAALEDPAVVAVQPVILDHQAQFFSAGYVCSPWSDLPFRLYAGAAAAELYLDRPRRVRMVSAICLAMRASDLAHVQGFDTEYETALDDADLCLRLLETDADHEDSQAVRAPDSASPGLLSRAWRAPTCNAVGGAPGPRLATRHCHIEPRVRAVFQGARFPGLIAPTRADRRRFLARWRGNAVPDALAHYAADGLQPLRWNVDDASRLETATQLYTPTLAPATDTSAVQPSDPFVYVSLDEALTRKHCIDVWLDGYRELRPGRPTVLLVAHYAPTEMFGGERSFIDVLRALDALELNVVVTLPRRPAPAYLQHVLASSHRVFLFRYDWWQGELAASGASVHRFSHICRLTGARAAYLNTMMCEAAALGARDAGIPVITHVRELITDDPWLAERIGLPVDAIVSGVSARSDCIVANSRAMASMFGGHPNVFVAPNVVDAADFDFPNLVNPARIVFGMISSNQPKKGLRDFFQLASRCHQLGLPAVFLLIGPENPHVPEAIVATCPDGVPANVELRGYIDDPRQAVAAVNVVLSLSWFAESFGRTVAEGFAARRPAIGYERGAIPELVEDGVTGFLVAPGDIDALVRAVSTFCQHPELITAFGEHGRQRVLAAHQPPDLQAGVARALQSVSILE